MTFCPENSRSIGSAKVPETKKGGPPREGPRERISTRSGVDPSIIFTSARFQGAITDTATIRARMNEVQTHRETAQPIREKTGGSTFKNPPGNSAWKLIDAAGCRGLRVGGAQVSEMHCNFLINTGNATGHDIETLGETVRERVKANSGIELHWEIKRIGIEQG